MAKLKDLIIKAIQERARVFSHDRTKSVGASETFACIRKNWFSKHKPELAEGDKNWGILERGNVIENAFFVPVMKHIYGEDKCLYMGDEQETLHNGKSSSTSDGMVYTNQRDIFADDGLTDIEAECFLMECKSFDSRTNLREEKAIHRGQSIMQLGNFRATTKHKPVWAVLLYINASDYTDIRPFFIRFDEEVYEAGRARNNKVFSTTDPYNLIPEGSFTDQCRYCPFTTACRDAQITHFPSGRDLVDDDTLNALEKLAVTYDEAKEAEKAAKEKKGATGAQIEFLLSVMANNRSVESDRFKITYTKMPGKESLDTARLKAYLIRHGASLDEFQKTGSDFTRLTVTLRD